MLVFPKRGIYGLTLRTWHIVLSEINTLQTYKKIVELTVISDGESRKETAWALRTDLYPLCVELKCWFGGTIMTFRRSASEAWNTLVVTLA